MTAFYNEPDLFAAQWLENLIAAGHIAPGVVDRRPIQQIEAWELEGYTQCHFFAGIGIWSLALRSAGWSDDIPVWTGSCPCQPFSSAGKQKGFDDERHLWPTWFKLIDQRRPAIVLGEQVASKDGLGWFDLVSTDMEASDYAVAAADLCAAGFGEAHLRQRLYVVGLAHHHHSRLEGRARMLECGDQRAFGSSSVVGGLADPVQAGRTERRTIARGGQIAGSGATSGLGNATGKGPFSGAHRRICENEEVTRSRNGKSERSIGFSATGGLADTRSKDQGGRGIQGYGKSDSESLRTIGERSSGFREDNGISRSIRNPGEIDQRWLDADWLLCRNPAGEPSWRPVEPGTFPLAHGVAARMDCLRAYGNALDKETATNFVAAVREIVGV